MKSTRLFRISLCSVFSCFVHAPTIAVEPVSQVAVVPKAPIALAEYFKIRRTSGASFSSDESLLAYASDEGGRMDIWVCPVVGGPARQLTHVKGFIESFEFSPASDLLLFAADIGGDELMQLYFTDSTGKDPVALFPDDSKLTRSDFVRWADDGRTLLYTSNRRDAKSMDLYEYDVTSKESKLLWQGDGTLSFVLASRDHQRFIFTQELSDANTNLYLLKRGEKDATLLTPHEGEIAFAAFDLSPDGRTLYYTSDESSEFTALHSMDVATKKSTPVMSPPWDVYGARFSRGGKYFYTSVDNDGTPEILLTDAATKKPVSLPTIEAPGFLVPAAFSKSDRWLAARLESDVAPRPVWLIDLQVGEQGQRTLNSLRRKNLHQELIAPAGHAALGLDAFFGRMTFQQTDREAA